MMLTGTHCWCGALLRGGRCPVAPLDHVWSPPPHPEAKVRGVLFVVGPRVGAGEYLKARLSLTAAGYPVVTLGNLTDPRYTARSSYPEYLSDSLARMLRCQGLALMPEWYSAPESELLVQVARASGLAVAPIEEWLS